MEYNISAVEYSSFIANQMIEQAKMERFIKECVLIGESANTIKNMVSLNESVSDKIKEAFKKILETIGRMWGKFLEAMSTLVNGNRAYLEKYKDIILKKKLNPNTTYKMYNYGEGVKRLLQTPVPILNYESMQSILDTPEHFISSNPNLNKIMVKNSDATFTDQAKVYFRGSSEVIDIASGKLNMTDIFNYCYNYEGTMKPLLEKDLKQIKTAANSAADIIDKAERENNTQPAQESYNIYGKKKYYSAVYEEYIEELEIIDKSTNNGNNDNDPAKNMNNVQGQAPKPDQQAQAVKNDSASYDDKIKKVQNYLNVCGGLLAAKQTIAEEIFKEYMQIVKAHVRDNVGTPSKNTSNDKVPDAGTNYKNIVDKAFGNNNNNGGQQ